MRKTKAQLEFENAELRERVTKLEASEATLRDVIMRLATAPSSPPAFIPYPVPAPSLPPVLPSPWSPMPTWPQATHNPIITCGDGRSFAETTITVTKPDIQHLAGCAPAMPFAGTFTLNPHGVVRNVATVSPGHPLT